MSEKKCIKYFAAHYCPHSNESSRTYHLINNLFKRKYPEVMVEVFWGEDVNEDNKHEFLNANAQYVPTITNSKYAHINLSLPPDFKTEGKSNDELTFSVLENIYNQLDKEKDEPNNTNKYESNNTEKENCTVENIQENIQENIEEDNEKSKDFIKETFGYLNNNKFIGFIFISLIIYLIVMPFCKNYKKKNVSFVSSVSSVLPEDSISLK